MPEYKRVRDPSTGAEYSYTDGQIAATGLTEADVIDKPALGPNGRPAPTKPRIPLGEPSPGSARERRRGNQTTGANSSGEDAGQTSAAPETEN